VRRPGVRTVVLCTDAGAHRLWVHPAIDRYLVCSEMAAGTVRQYLARADVRVIAPPVRPEFFDAPPAPVAREELQLSERRPAVLLLGGAWGTAPLEGVAGGLVDSGFSVVAVAGRNEALRRRLERVARAKGGGLLAFGYREDMPRLVAACDVVVTSPGQACHEARVVGRPLVVLDTVPGHGRENVLLELARGGALASPGRTDAVVAATRAALDGAAGRLADWPVKSAEQWGDEFRAAVGDA
jgi:processive 1,2-diacylglycerol beta-glucosyltransferase